MKIGVRFPGNRASDPRITVKLEELGTPWPIRLHFLGVYDDQTEEHQYVHVGFEIGERIERQPGGPGRRPGHPAGEGQPIDPNRLVGLDPVAVQRIASNYASYLELARHAIVLEKEGIDGAIRRLRPSRKPARLTDDFYRLIGADFEARRQAGATKPVQEIADSQHAEYSTAARWVREARRRGYITEPYAAKRVAH